MHKLFDRLFNWHELCVCVRARERVKKKAKENMRQTLWCSCGMENEATQNQKPKTHSSIVKVCVLAVVFIVLSDICKLLNVAWSKLTNIPTAKAQHFQWNREEIIAVYVIHLLSLACSRLTVKVFAHIKISSIFITFSCWLMHRSKIREQSIAFAWLWF